MLDHNLNMRLSNMMNYLQNQKISETYNNFLKKSPSLEEILRHDGTIKEIMQGNPVLIS